MWNEECVVVEKARKVRQEVIDGGGAGPKGESLGFFSARRLTSGPRPIGGMRISRCGTINDAFEDRYLF